MAVSRKLDRFEICSEVWPSCPQHWAVSVRKSSVELMTVITVNKHTLAVAEVEKPGSTLLDFVRLTITLTKPRSARQAPA